jgi:transposase
MNSNDADIKKPIDVDPDQQAWQIEKQGLQQEIQSLKSQLDWFKQQIFGQKSEKRPDIFSQQGSLNFGDLPSVATPPQPGQKISYTRKARSSNKEKDDENANMRFSDDVPVQEIELPCPELEGPNADNYEAISEKYTYRIAQRPGSYVVLKYIRKVVKRKSDQTIKTTAAPSAIFDRSLADVSFLAGMLVEKFAYHCPLYRQHQKLKDSGIEISRATLTNLSNRAIDLLRPIYLAMLISILNGNTISMDETSIKAGRKKKGKMRQAYFWPILGDQGEIAFTYSPTRALKYVREVLGDFEGTLVTDGYPVYDRYAKSATNVVHALCWSHMRRTFVRAEKIEPEAVESALAYIAALYKIDNHIKDSGITAQEKLDYRDKYAKPLVNDFFVWVDEQCHRNDLDPSNPLSKALKYTIERQAGLRIFLNDPEVPMDTNHLERALRPIPMGRKNYLFCWTEVGAELVGIIQSLIVTCRMHSINPYEYLVDVLQRVEQHPASQVHELTPRVWKEKFGQNFLKSDLDR